MTLNEILTEGKITVVNHDGFIEFIANDGFKIKLNESNYVSSCMMGLKDDYDVSAITNEDYETLMKEAEKKRQEHMKKAMELATA